MISDDCACCICKFNNNDSYCELGNAKFGTEEVKHTDDCEDFDDMECDDEYYDEYAIKENNAPWDAWGMDRDSDDEGENFGW